MGFVVKRDHLPVESTQVEVGVLKAEVVGPGAGELDVKTAALKVVNGGRAESMRYVTRVVGPRAVIGVLKVVGYQEVPGLR